MAIQILCFDDSVSPPQANFAILSPSAVGVLVRVMRQVSTNDTVHAVDGGLIVTAPGTTQTLEGYSAAQSGNPYVVKNASSGDTTVVTVSGETIQTASGTVTSIVVATDNAIQFIRNGANTAQWIIQ